MVIAQAEVWWADLGEPIGSASAYRRPVVIVQCDALNQSRINTVVAVPLTSNLKWADAPGNVLLSSQATGLPKASVANVSHIVPPDKSQLVDCAGKRSRRQLDLVLTGMDVMLGR